MDSVTLAIGAIIVVLDDVVVFNVAAVVGGGIVVIGAFVASASIAVSGAYVMDAPAVDSDFVRVIQLSILKLFLAGIIIKSVPPWKAFSAKFNVSG